MSRKAEAAGFVQDREHVGAIVFDDDDDEEDDDDDDEEEEEMVGVLRSTFFINLGVGEEHTKLASKVAESIRFTRLWTLPMSALRVSRNSCLASAVMTIS